MHDWEEVSLDNIHGGAAIERFNDALSEIIDNIIDPNTEPDKIREIKISVKFKPAKEDRKQVAYIINVEKKLAPARPVGSFMFVGKDKGKSVAFEQNANQGDLFKDNEKGELKILKVEDSE